MHDCVVRKLQHQDQKTLQRIVDTAGRIYWYLSSLCTRGIDSTWTWHDTDLLSKKANGTPWLLGRFITRAKNGHLTRLGKFTERTMIMNNDDLVNKWSPDGHPATNYRPITYLSTAWKILSVIIAGKLGRFHVQESVHEQSSERTRNQSQRVKAPATGRQPKLKTRQAKLKHSLNWLQIWCPTHGYYKVWCYVTNKALNQKQH